MPNSERKRTACGRGREHVEMLSRRCANGRRESERQFCILPHLGLFRPFLCTHRVFPGQETACECLSSCPGVVQEGQLHSHTSGFPAAGTKTKPAAPSVVTGLCWGVVRGSHVTKTQPIQEQGLLLGVTHVSPPSIELKPLGTFFSFQEWHGRDSGRSDTLGGGNHHISLQ